MNGCWRIFWWNERSWRRRRRPLRGEVPARVVYPGIVGQGVRAEGFEVALLFVVEEGAVEAEGAGLGVIGEAGGIAGAHLEEDAHGEFAEGLSAEETGDVVVGVKGGDEVDAVGRAFCDNFAELSCG